MQPLVRAEDASHERKAVSEDCRMAARSGDGKAERAEGIYNLQEIIAHLFCYVKRDSI